MTIATISSVAVGSKKSVVRADRSGTGAGEHDPLLDDVTGFTRAIDSVFRPNTLSEVRQLLQDLYRTKVPMHVVSTGLNWGYGSALPPRDEGVIVSLELLNSIRCIRVNADNAYAVIESGVTQGVLADHLASHFPEWLINATGSSPKSSVLGNCLDRGIGYFGLRSADVLSLQVLLPNGELVWTTRPTPDEPSFPFQSGPDLTGTLLQSGGGIVVAGAIRLYRKRLVHAMLGLELRDGVPIHEALDRLRRCVSVLSGVGVAHWGNHHRAIATAGIAIEDYVKRNGLSINPRLVQSFVERRFTATWTGILPIYGTANEVKAIQAAVRKALKRVAKVRLITERRLSFAKRFFSFAYFLPDAQLFKALIDVSVQLCGLSEGRPTYLPTEQALATRNGAIAGLFYFAPVLHGNSSDIGNALRAIEAVYEKHRFVAGVTLNTVPNVGIVAITNAAYKRNDDAELVRALVCLDDLHNMAKQHDLLLYRRDIDHMDAIPSARHEIVSRVACAFDPDGLVSPGRYREVGL